MLAPNGADRIIADFVVAFDKLEQRDDDASWEKAECYLESHDKLKTDQHYAHKKGMARTRLINSDIRSKCAELNITGPRPSFLSHALKLNQTWSELFAVDRKILPYDHYMRIAVASLPLKTKNKLRAQAERERPIGIKLRQLIREAVNAHNGIFKPDFPLKASNFWKFNSPHDNNEYGGVHPEVYANILYWFTDPGDTIIDPMAGTGLLSYTLGAYRFFRDVYQADGSGPRIALMSDKSPTQENIIAADATVSVPFGNGIAKLAIIDPPYLIIADGKYDNIGATLDQWLANLERIVQNVRRCLRPNGLIAIMTDDVLRKKEHVPIAYHITAMLARNRFIPKATIYNHAPNFVWTMGPAQMVAARKEKLQCNGCKVIQVATCGSS